MVCVRVCVCVCGNLSIIIVPKVFDFHNLRELYNCGDCNTIWHVVFNYSLVD